MQYTAADVPSGRSERGTAKFGVIIQARVAFRQTVGMVTTRLTLVARSYILYYTRNRQAVLFAIVLARCRFSKPKKPALATVGSTLFLRSAVGLGMPLAV